MIENISQISIVHKYKTSIQLDGYVAIARPKHNIKSLNRSADAQLCINVGASRHWPRHSWHNGQAPRYESEKAFRVTAVGNSYTTLRTIGDRVSFETAGRASHKAHHGAVRAHDGIGMPPRTRLSKTRDLRAALDADGWVIARNGPGDHVQFKHPTKPGRVTVDAGRREQVIGTLRSVYRQAGWEW